MGEAETANSPSHFLTADPNASLSKPVVKFSRRRCNSPKQVHPAPLSSPSAVVTVDEGIASYPSFCFLLFSPSVVLITVIAALRFLPPRLSTPPTI